MSSGHPDKLYLLIFRTQLTCIRDCFLLVFLLVGVKPDKWNVCICPEVVLHKWADDVPTDGDCQSLSICRSQVMADFIVGLGLCIASATAV